MTTTFHLGIGFLISFILRCSLCMGFDAVFANSTETYVNIGDDNIVTNIEDNIFATYGKRDNSKFIELADHISVTSQIKPGEQHFYLFQLDSTDINTIGDWEELIFLSGNICSQPDSSNEAILKVFYSFDPNIADNLEGAERANFHLGYMEALAVSTLTTIDEIVARPSLYILVELVNSKDGTALPASAGLDDEPWVYTFAASTNFLNFQWDSNTHMDVVATDYNSALLTTITLYNLTRNSSFGLSGDYFMEEQRYLSNKAVNISTFDLLLYSIDHQDSTLSRNMSRSLCAISNGPTLASSYYSVSERENSTLSSTELKISKSFTTRGNQLKQQFHITGLNSSTSYVAYLRQNNLESASDTIPTRSGVIYNKLVFTTLAGPSCSLIFGLDFCSEIAYAVPSSSLVDIQNKVALSRMYDSLAESWYTNFSLALQLVPCGAEDDTIYSPLRDCSLCAASYKSWLCAVSIPRCTTDIQDYYKPRSRGDGRSDKIAEVIQPVSDYYEILPCIDMCHAMVRDCPATFKFSCPSTNKYTQLTYRSYFVHEEPPGTELKCNLVQSS